MDYLLGIDIGTSGTKTVLFDKNAKIMAEYTGEYPLYQEHNGWADQKPEDWWKATVDGIKYVLAESKVKADDIKGIGLSGQMHGLVLLDENDQVLRPCIIWADQRTTAEVEELEEKVGREKLIEISANPPMASFTAAKLLWVRNNEPEIYEKIEHVLLPKDYIRFKLTGEYVSDVSDASGTQLMNVRERDWSDEILDILDIPKDILPELVESPEISGYVTKACSEKTGLADGTIVVGGAGDNPAVAIGTGIYKEGRAFNTIGTSAVIYSVTDEPRIDKDGRIHTLCASVPNKWTLMSCTQGAGLSLHWLRELVSKAEMEVEKSTGIDAYDLMTKAASQAEIGSNKLIYLPYLIGERSPHLDPYARGVFFGLSSMHGKPEIIRAVLEGVAYSQRECLDVFRDNDVSLDDIVITGGGGKSDLWRHILADLYDIPVRILSTDKGGSLGAAILAGVGAGIYDSIASACDELIEFNEAEEPDHEAHEAYEPYYKLYKQLYRDLKTDFEKLANI